MSDPFLNIELYLTKKDSLKDVILSLKKGEPPLSIYLQGIKGSGASYIITKLLCHFPYKKGLIITPDREIGAILKDELSFFYKKEGNRPPDNTILLYRGEDFSPYHEVLTDKRGELLRASILYKLLKRDFILIISSIEDTLRYTIPTSSFISNILKLKKGEIYSREKLLSYLVDIGYTRAPIVEEEGFFSVRGDIVDIFPPGLKPYRITFYDELIESIRNFDPITKCSKENEFAELEIYPIKEVVVNQSELQKVKIKLRDVGDELRIPTKKLNRLLEKIIEIDLPFGNATKWLPAYYERCSILLDYIEPNDLFIFIIEPSDVEARIESLLKNWEELYHQEINEGNLALPPSAYFSNFPFLISYLRQTPTSIIYITSTQLLQNRQDDIEKSFELNLVDSKFFINYFKTNKKVVDYIQSLYSFFTKEGIKPIFVMASKVQANRIKEILNSNKVEVEIGPLHRGVWIVEEGVIYITEEELFDNKINVRSLESYLKPKSIIDIGSIKPGDLVVHIYHGIGRYLGLKTQKIRDEELEYAVIEYADNGKLYLPIYKINQIHRYIGDKDKVKLDSLDKNSFLKRKLEVSKAVEEIADKLLQLYAVREKIRREPYPLPNDIYLKFEAEFPFEETADQIKAIEEIMADLSSPRPMDRLICGDVGFGKTEVALRAAIRVVLGGKQVAVLVPTTILAQQHYLTFSQRLKDYPVNVEVISRLKSEKEQKEILKKLKTGQIDIIIGTHRLLSKDVHFYDLGLLIIDEEHRFGVAHKEKIKQLKKSIDVLTMTATPIPRTLNMALNKLKEISLITTPPPGRLSVKTYVIPKDDVRTIRTAILKELERGGQLFFVVKHIKDIPEKKSWLELIVPEAKVGIAHGRLPKDELEKVMIDFINHHYDILLSTTIVESGLDIPNVNTIIIDDADQFGLSQLYQLRGRIGRSTIQAYAYLLINRKEALKESAKERLSIIKQFTSIGSGFNVAIMDMELRGVGNLLGKEQSGHINSVGLELYSMLINEAVAKMKGEESILIEEPDLHFPHASYIPSNYIEDPVTRFNIYHTLSRLEDEEEIEQFKLALINQFGEAPEEVNNYFLLAKLRIKALKLGIEGIVGTPSQIIYHIGPKTTLDPYKVANILLKNGKYKLIDGIKLVRRLSKDETKTNLIELTLKLLPELNQCVKNHS